MERIATVLEEHLPGQRRIYGEFGGEGCLILAGDAERARVATGPALGRRVS